MLTGPGVSWVCFSLESKARGDHWVELASAQMLALARQLIPTPRMRVPTPVRAHVRSNR